MVTPRELTADPRARRQTLVAKARGIDIVGLCLHLPGEKETPLEGIPVIRLAAGGLSSRLRSSGLGGMKRSPPPVRELRGLFRLARLARMALLVSRAGRRLGPFDVVHANDFDALPGGWLLAHSWNARLVYDAHELYHAMEPDPPRLYQALAARLEGVLARRADVVVTTCDPFADELRRTLRLEREPVIVLNCPDVRLELPPRAPTPRLRAIYQAGGSHSGRPVEDLLVAAEHAPDVEVTVRVLGIDRPGLQAEARRRGLGDRFIVAEPVPPDRLLDGLVTHDVGLIINRPLTRNDELPVPNKLFEYMMAGLAVAVPRLPGLVAFVEGEATGVTFEPEQPDELGRALQELARDRERLAAMQERARRLALARFNAPVQAEALTAAWGLRPAA